MNVIKLLGTASATALLAAALAVPASAEGAKAMLKDKAGKDVGNVEFTQTQAGVLLKVAVKGLPAGEHAFHIHAVGKCEPPFESAGGHFNPDNHKHGMEAGEGHAGDMPNLHIPKSGELMVEILNAKITLEKGKPNSVFDDDGSSAVIHADKDDYKSDPAGNAGGRIACGVIREASTTVELRDGQSFMLGGLLQNNSLTNQDQLPWLGDVPVLGALFRSAAPAFDGLPAAAAEALLEMQVRSQGATYRAAHPDAFFAIIERGGKPCGRLIVAHGPMSCVVDYALLPDVRGIGLGTAVLAAVLVLVYFTIINEIGSNVLYPKLVGDALGLHTVLVLFVLFAGMEVAGIIGALFSAPLTALAIVTIVHVYRYWQGLPDGGLARVAQHEGAKAAQNPNGARDPGAGRGGNAGDQVARARTGLRSARVLLNGEAEPLELGGDEACDRPFGE